MDLVQQLTRDEGIRNKPYVDTVGKVTIGVGRNLSDVGLYPEEISILLQNDIARVQMALEAFPWYVALDPVRQAAIDNMAFNIGLHGLLGFPSMIHYLTIQDWYNASEQALQSTWATQVGDRATRIAQQILTGQWV
jgi:lysozyme